MSEQLSPNSGEMGADPDTIFDELTSAPGWRSFREAVDDWEGRAVIYDQDVSEERIQDLEEELVDMGELIGYDYLGNDCHVLGLAYVEGDDGKLEYEPVALSTKRGRLLTPIMLFLAEEDDPSRGRWRVVLEIEVELDEPRTIVSADGHGSHMEYTKLYYLRPDEKHIMDLHVAPESEDERQSRGVITQFSEVARDSQECVASAKFASLPAAEQRAILDGYLDELGETFPHALRNCQVVVDCSEYRAGYADTLGVEATVPIDLDADAKAYGMPAVCKGEVYAFSYVELDGISEAVVLTPDSFVYDGSPCMVIKPEDSAILYYIPLTAIRGLM